MGCASILLCCNFYFRLFLSSWLCWIAISVHRSVSSLPLLSLSLSICSQLRFAYASPIINHYNIYIEYMFPSHKHCTIVPVFSTFTYKWICLCRTFHFFKRYECFFPTLPSRVAVYSKSLCTLYTRLFCQLNGAELNREKPHGLKFYV